MFVTYKINIHPSIRKDHPHCFDFNDKNWILARAPAEEEVGVSSLGSLRMLCANGKEETKRCRGGGEQAARAPRVTTRVEKGGQRQVNCLGQIR